MKNEHNPIRQDIGYDLPQGELTLDQAKALYAQGLGGKAVARMVKRDLDREFFDEQLGIDSSLPPLTPEEQARAHRGYLLAVEALRDAKASKSDK